MRVLVPMDGSDPSWAAFEHAIDRYPEATLVCLRVVDPLWSGGGVVGDGAAVADEWLEAERDAAEETFEAVRDRAAEAGVDVETEIEVGRPARAITEFAEGSDHVVVGSHGRDGVSRVLLGSVAETVVRRSPVPVTVVR